MAQQAGDILSIGTGGWYENEAGGGSLPAPDAPVLSVVMRSSTLAILSWTTGGHADNYKIYVDAARWPDGTTTFLSSPQTITGLTAETSYAFKVAASNATADTDSNIVTTSTPATDPILTRFEAQALILIEAMTTGGGYNYSWGDCNQIDEALKDSYPNAEIYIIGEENDDPEDGAHASAYENKVNVEIHVKSKNTSISTGDVPNFTINPEHNKAADDLKRVFGLNQSVNDTVNSILYRGMSRTRSLAGDVFRVGDLVTSWLVSYTQDRQSPEVNAN